MDTRASLGIVLMRNIPLSLGMKPQLSSQIMAILTQPASLVLLQVKGKIKAFFSKTVKYQQTILFSLTTSHTLVDKGCLYLMVLHHQAEGRDQTACSINQESKDQ